MESSYSKLEPVKTHENQGGRSDEGGGGRKYFSNFVKGAAGRSIRCSKILATEAAEHGDSNPELPRDTPWPLRPNHHTHKKRKYSLDAHSVPYTDVLETHTSSFIDAVAKKKQDDAQKGLGKAGRARSKAALR